MTVMERAQQHRNQSSKVAASSNRGPRAIGVGGAEPGAERLSNLERL
jgi:hypothetical protein